MHNGIDFRTLQLFGSNRVISQLFCSIYCNCEKGQIFSVPYGGSRLGIYIFALTRSNRGVTLLNKPYFLEKKRMQYFISRPTMFVRSMFKWWYVQQ